MQMQNRIAIKTERLTLLAPTAAELYAAVRQPRQLATVLGLRLPENDDTHYYRNKGGIYDAKAHLMDAIPDEWLLCTAWQLCLDDVLIGEAGFKGEPYRGEVEIGYALRSTYEGHGYMTEAVSALCRFAFTTDVRIKSIVAQTKWRNAKSQQVLTRCGFVRDGYRSWHYLFRLTRGAWNQPKIIK